MRHELTKQAKETTAAGISLDRLAQTIEGLLNEGRAHWEHDNAILVIESFYQAVELMKALDLQLGEFAFEGKWLKGSRIKAGLI